MHIHTRICIYVRYDSSSITCNLFAALSKIIDRQLIENCKQKLTCYQNGFLLYKNANMR